MAMFKPLVDSRNIILIFLSFQFCYGYIGDDAKKNHEDRACEGYKMKMLCPATDLINVQLATYGRQDDETCIVEKERMANTHCTLGNSFKIVSKMCNGKSECEFIVDGNVFPDPCPGTSKYLNVIWDCMPALIHCPGKLNSLTRTQSLRTAKQTNGTWVRDPMQLSQKIYYMSWSKYDSSTLYEYNTLEQLESQTHQNFHHLGRIDGTGFVVYDGCVYYNVERSRTIAKFDLGKNRVTDQLDLNNANYHGTSPYAVEMDTDIDMAVDENGLWIIYATEANGGNIVLSRLHRQTLTVLGTWYTSYEKLSALNAFVVCGVLYVVSYDRLQIEYMYNTTSSVERRIQIPILGLKNTTSAMEYNPKDQMVYVWDRGVASLYKINFDTTGSPSSIAPASPTHSQTSTVLPPKTTLPKNVDSDAGDGAVSPHSLVPSQSPPIKGECLSVEASGLKWPNTSFSKSAVLGCPGTGEGQAIWICGGSPTNPQWTPQSPDLSQCTSPWVNSLIQKIEEGRVPAVGLAEKLAKEVRRNVYTLTSWDIVEIVRLLKDFIKASSFDARSASSVTNSILKSTSELLRPVLVSAWNGLGTKLQTQTSTELVHTLELAAFFLAKDMASARTSKNSITWSQHYATLAIRIEPVPSQLANHQRASAAVPSSNVVTLNSGHGDSVTIRDHYVMQALGAKPGQKVAIIHLSLKNLGRHIVDKHGMGSDSYPVNSQVVTLSARVLDTEGRWIIKKEQNVNLVQPITLHLKHINHHYKKHVCAFWDQSEESQPEKSQWSRAGCVRVSGNASYSVCQCEHLTSFVVLSSDRKFPLLGADTEDPEEQSVDIFYYINIVRGGMIVSLVFLLMTLVTLCCLRQSSDVTTVHRNLLLCFFLTELIFLAGIGQVHYKTLCTTVAAFLHYGVLCTFTWAALQAAHHVLALNDGQEHKRWKYYYVIGYGLPTLVVVISVAVDSSAFGSQKACWIRTSDDFIWAFIAPCCLAIVSTLALVAALLYKLSKIRTTLLDEDYLKTVRSDAASTCIIMFLLCMMWSATFLWISGFYPHLTSWLVSVFSCFSGVAFFVLFCALPSDNNLINECRGCFKKEATRNRYRNPSSRNPFLRYPPDSSMQTVLGRDGTTTTLLPSNDPQAVPLVKPIPVGVTASTPAVSTLSHGHELGQERRVERHTFNMVDDTDPKLPTSVRNNNMTWNDYVPNAENSIPEAVASGGAACRCGRYLNGQQASGGPQYCVCPSTTYNSCCYDRLHDGTFRRGAMQCNKLICNKCKLQKLPVRAGCQKRVASHHYETLGPFLDQEDDQENAPAIRGYQLRNRHPYEEVDVSGICMQVMHPPLTSCIKDVLHSQSSDHRLVAPNVGRCSCSCVIPLSSSSKTDLPGRSGRQSDPLSTDQGYDTDSQQPPMMMNHFSLCEGEVFQSSPQPVEMMPPQESLRERRSSPASSDSSENDREVEIINSSLQTRRHPSSDDYVTSVSSLQRGPYGDDVIMTHAKEGNLSAFDTVKSWSAISGTRLKSAYPANGGVKSNRKSTIDPQVILAQARQKHELRSSVESSGSGGLKDKTGGIGYTLPGTAAAGTKARIDLRTGGVCMTTNL